jgi:hypothetical protein
MTGEQFELAFMTAGGAVAMLVGYGVIDLGPKADRVKRTLRLAGSVLVICALVLLAVSFAK